MIIQLNENNFEEEVLKSNKPVVVDFYADWCGPCQSMHPIYEEFAKEMEDKTKVCIVNVDENLELSARYKVSSIPCVVFFIGGREVKRLIGSADKKKLNDTVKRIL